MSRHIFYTEHHGLQKYVLMGWDSPLQGFFMVIDSPDSEDDEPYWSNLSLKNPYPKTFDGFLEVLAQQNIALPKQMIEEILEDSKRNLGNKDITHSYNNGVYNRAEGITTN